jgi:hypothetical protein
MATTILLPFKVVTSLVGFKTPFQGFRVLCKLGERFALNM